MTLIQLTIVCGMRAVYNLYVGKFNKEDVGLSKKKVVLDDIVSKLRRINESDGYVTKFYQSPTEYKKLKKEGESEPYERPYEKKLVERGLPTDNKVSEEVLKYYFQTDERLRKNDDLNTVLVKVTLLNAFYRTTIDNINLVAVARYICSLHFDELINSQKDEKPNFDLVKKFAYHQIDDLPEIGDNSFLQFRIKTRNGIKEHANNLYSFSTKYCAWHKPDVYPIVDSYTKGVLYHLVNDNIEIKEYMNLENGITDEQLNDYFSYYEIYEKFRKYLRTKNQINVSMKDLDIFLWSYGEENMIYR